MSSDLKGKALGDIEEIKKRLKLLEEPHIRSLTEFVTMIRADHGLEWHVPYFDPHDGGNKARCLFVFESPGARAVLSGFISRDNPDETAKNFLTFNEQAGLDRRETILWNIVPWYVSDVEEMRAKHSLNAEKGFEYLMKLPPHLHNLTTVVLFGDTAKQFEQKLRKSCPNLKIFNCYHPSPNFVNRNKDENQKQIINTLKEVAKFLKEN